MRFRLPSLPFVSPLLLPFLALALALALLSPLPATAYSPSNPHHGQGRRVALSSLRALTFFNGLTTRSRRGQSLPQLTCAGDARQCARFQPGVVACTSLGDGQWRCEADLPPSQRLGRVEVSCEGWSAPSDPFVLKDSCALTYELLPANAGLFAPEEDHLRHATTRRLSNLLRPSTWSLERALDFAFPVIFLAVLGWIVLGFFRSVRRDHPAPGTGPRWGGGGGGGGGGGWGGPGWGYPHNRPDSPPPPPYFKSEPGTSSPAAQQGTGTQPYRPGFWTGLAAGAAGALFASASASNNRRRGQAGAHPYDPDFGNGNGNGAGTGGGGGLGAGWAAPQQQQQRGGGRQRTAYGYGYGNDRDRDRDRDREYDRFGSPASGSGGAGGSSLRTSTGFGGTRNR